MGNKEEGNDLPLPVNSVSPLARSWNDGCPILAHGECQQTMPKLLSPYGRMFFPLQRKNLPA
jgi:hypothetical protein